MKKLLEKLFKYDTQNTEDAPSVTILPCMEELAEYLRADDVRVELQKYEVISRFGEKITHANLLAYPSNHRGKFILLQGHIDTVPFSGSYKFNIGEESIIGRGAVDMKGPLAGMVAAFKELARDHSLKYAPMLLITGDEEANSFAGIKYFLKENRLPLLFAITGEPTDLKVATKFRGVSMYNFEMVGHAGHSSSRDEDKLIEKAIPLLNAIQRFLDEARKIENSDFGKTIGALTFFNAGIKDNQLPENLRVAFNLRTVTDSARYENLYRNIVEPYIPKDTKTKYHSFDPVRVNIPESYLASIAAAFKKCDIVHDVVQVNAFTEATLMNQSGIPSLDIGPGDMSLAHVRQEDEHISIRDIDAYCSLLIEIIRGF
jgi:acetylornithine deacetylase/succinyl-diaminopimelate desuccinylase-like protein